MNRAVDVANFIVERSLDKKQPIDVFRLNKALFVAQGISLSKRGKALFSDTIEAWQHGPVVRDVYFAFKQKASKAPITSVSDKGASEKLTCEDVLSVFDALAFYDLLESHEIYDIMHDENGPWKQYYRPGVKNTPIPNDAIKEYFDFDFDAPTRSERLFSQIPQAKRTREFNWSSNDLTPCEEC